MNWDRTETVALAKRRCEFCQGRGTRLAREQETGVCPCVLRSIFRACYERFKECIIQERHMSKISLTHSSKGRDNRLTYHRLVEDYICDFTLISKRSLGEDEYRLFRYHFLLGADWKLCCRQLGLERSDFFHTVYYIMQKLGRIFRELKPYGLFPLDEYFAGRVDDARPPLPPDLPSMLLEFPSAYPSREEEDEARARPGRPLRPPLREAA